MANYATEITAREYYSVHGSWGEPHIKFRHTIPDGRPATVIDGNLEDKEQAVIKTWIEANDIGKICLPPEKNLDGTDLSVAAQENIADIGTVLAGSAYQVWVMGNLQARLSQWRWFCSDIHDASSATLSRAADTSGTGSGAVDTSGGIPPTDR